MILFSPYPLLILFLITMSVLPGCCDSTDAFPFFQPFTPARTTQPMAHRGLWIAAPENTMPAFELAVRMGIEWIEVDVRLTRDGQHAIVHDSTLDAKTDGTGAVASHTWEELAQLDAGSWMAPRFTHTRLLRLPDLLAYAKGKLNVYLDCKSIDPQRLVNEICQSVMENQVVVYGGIDLLHTVRTLSKGTIPLLAKCHHPEHLAELIAKVSPAMIEVNPEDLNRPLVEEAHKQGISVQWKALGEPDHPAEWEKAVDLGVDFIQTDHADELQAFLFHRQIPQPACWISAHRGVGALAPENTQAAIEQAIRLGCEWVEIDVRTTQDGQLVLMHDSTLNRTTSLQGFVATIPFRILKETSAGAWFSNLYTNEKVPTLQEVLAWTKGKIRIYLDNKDSQPQVLVEQLSVSGGLDDVLIYDGDLRRLEQIRQLAPTLKLMPPLRRIEDIESMADRISPYAFDTAWEALSKDLIEACHRKNIKVFSDAMGQHDNLDDYLHAIRMGIDLIQTDNPLLLQRALEIASFH